MRRRCGRSRARRCARSTRVARPHHRTRRRRRCRPRSPGWACCSTRSTLCSTTRWSAGLPPIEESPSRAARRAHRACVGGRRGAWRRLGTMRAWRELLAHRAVDLAGASSWRRWNGLAPTLHGARRALCGSAWPGTSAASACPPCFAHATRARLRRRCLEWSVARLCVRDRRLSIAPSPFNVRLRAARSARARLARARRRGARRRAALEWRIVFVATAQIALRRLAQRVAGMRNASLAYLRENLLRRGGDRCGSHPDRCRWRASGRRCTCCSRCRASRAPILRGAPRRSGAAWNGNGS